MKTLDLGNRRSRVWTGELPDAAYAPTKVLFRTFAANREPAAGLDLAAVELFVPRGPHALYGLLGGRLQPEETDQLTVEIGTSSAGGKFFADSLAMKVDDVRVGLPAEYAQGVLAGMDSAKLELETLRPGKLSIDHAAHGAIGSCEAIFKHLAEILMRILHATNAQLSDQELIKLFPLNI